MTLGKALALSGLRLSSHKGWLVLFEGAGGSGGGRQDPGRAGWATAALLGRQAGLPGHARPKDVRKAQIPTWQTPQKRVQ